MRTDLLLEHLDALVTTSEDVGHLEAAILQLAVRGKLVPQDPGDEPGTELFERIRVEKERFIVDTGFKRKKPLSPLPDSEIPYRLPSSWKWCKVGECTFVIRGASPRPKGDPRYFSEERTPYHWVKISDIRKFAEGNVLTDTSEFLTEAGMRKSQYVDKGTLILTNSATIGVPIFLGVDGCIHDGYLAFPFSGGDGIVAEYLYYYFLGLGRVIRDRARGLAQLNLNTTIVRNLPFPLPPLAEQKRIVAKVESLLSQTRALAARLEQADEALVPTAQAAFQALLDAPDAAAQRAAWQRVAEHFDTLTGGARAIETLKQAILQLAVQGRLVPQDPADEPASVLVERIKAEKERLAQEGKIGKSKRSSPLKGREIPCQLPRSWVWVRLDQLLAGIRAGRSPRAQKHPASREEQGVLKVSAVSWGEFLPNENKALLPGTSMDNVPSVRAGDFLISRANTSQLVGAVVLVRQSYPNLFLSDKTLRLDFVSDEVFKPYLIYAMRASWVRQVFEDTATGTSRSMQNISQTKIRSAPIALPSLSEQKRIVAKVESLLALCDDLAARVAGAEEVRGRLLRAVLNGEQGGYKQ